MTVTERLMKAGQFTVNLTDDAPRSAWAAVQEFDHIVITPTRLLPVESFSDANILAQAIYTGVVVTKPTNRTISGLGLADWLGDDEGGGDVLDTAVTNTNATLSTWVTSLLPSSITAGTVTNTGTNLTYTYQFMSRREALSHACRSVGAEWRVNADGTFDAAAPATLFVATPDTVITRHPQGTEGALQGIEATRLEQSRDVAKYTTKVIVVGKTGDGALVATGSATGANVYKDLFNNNVVKERLVNAPAEPAANVSAYAASVLALYGSVRRRITLSSSTYAVPIRTRPGDYLWVYDPEAYLADLANQITWRGELITPIKLRCHSYTWPIEAGMGVYVRRSGATPTYTDLTPFVEWENGRDTTWEIGASFADPDQAAEQLSPAFLGVNGDILQRTGGSPYTKVTSTITASNGSWESTGTQPNNYTITWEYNIGGGRCRGTMNATAGATFARGTGTYRWQHPLGAVMPAGRATNICGTGRILDSGTGVNNDLTALIDDSGQITLRFSASPTAATGIGTDTTVGETSPMTWAANDRVEIVYDFPLA